MNAGVANASPRVSMMSAGELDYFAQMQAEEAGRYGEFLRPVARPPRLPCYRRKARGRRILRGEGHRRSHEGQRVAPIDGICEQVVHPPSHVETINRVFGPKPEKIEWAKRVEAAIKEGRKKVTARLPSMVSWSVLPTIIEVRRIFAAAGIETDI